MGLIILAVLMAVFYVIVIFNAKDTKREMMCIERCNKKDNKKECEYCIDKEQCDIK